MQQSFNVESIVFGKKTLKKKGGFSVNFEWLKNNISIEYDFYEAYSPQEQLNLIEKKFKNIKQWNEEILSFVTAELYELANEEWKDERTEDYTFEKFKNQLRITSLTLRFTMDDIKMTFWLIDQDEIFGSHAIEMFATLNKGYISASIVG